MRLFSARNTREARSMGQGRVKRALLAGVLPLIVLGMSGCGGSDSGAADSSGAQLIKKGTLTVAMSGEYKPFSFSEGEKLVGFDKDIGDAVAQKMGLTPEAKSGAFDTLIQGVKSGRYDVIIGSMTPTPERENAVQFTDGYYTSGAQTFVRKDSDCTDPTKLKDATVGVTRGTTYESYLKDKGWAKDVKTYQSDVTALVDLDKGRMDAVVTDKLVGLGQIKEAKRDLKTCGDLLYKEEPAFAVKKGNDGLVKELNQALADVKKDGTYKKLSEKWFGQDIS